MPKGLGRNIRSLSAACGTWSSMHFFQLLSSSFLHENHDISMWTNHDLSMYVILLSLHVKPIIVMVISS